jgi:hypothetical protein
VLRKRFILKISAFDLCFEFTKNLFTVVFFYIYQKSSDNNKIITLFLIKKTKILTKSRLRLKQIRLFPQRYYKIH